ncbi:hypothetical protein LCER1_G008410 [Lachnellula cervina]|uniref:Uncharacterized protein n=1 Tax=Lachnellula cervina TaxID=1316786 RepID=A0A7D8YHI0_9HELO|nr:hypothetical protein LCER1_G008410 [Lachnellula cervina]
MSFNVYLVEYSGMPRNHRGIFVETKEDGGRSGYLYQVTGDILHGMVYQHKPAKEPETSATFSGLKELIGTVTTNNYVHIRSVVDSIPPPKKQYDGFKKIFPNEPLRRCHEWTNEAIQALKDRGIIQRPVSPSTSYWIYSDKYQRYCHVHEDGRTEWAPEASGSTSQSSSSHH